MGQTWGRSLTLLSEEMVHPDNAALEISNFYRPDEDEELEDEPNFPDLSHLPPEVALKVLSHLNATDLCLAACVWQQLATDEILWQGLCKEQWPEASIYHKANGSRSAVSMRKVFLLFDEGTLTFNSDPEKGMQYFFKNGLVRNQAFEIAKFFHSTSKLSKSQMRAYLQNRTDVVDEMIALQNYANEFLPNALRKCFAKLEAPNDRGQYLQEMLTAFSRRFCQCNPNFGHSTDSVYVMCFSLILLSVDLCSPHVKNKMSKREFIRNTRNAIQLSHDDLYGEMYDNVFLRGHVSEDGKSLLKLQHQFVPGFLALFL
ncbi:hypothetical protein TCAL_01931 [Tigriopus californicus]|uniref:SEC7 domain-containing protein n=1 Tax=Tigriopus californicus TaxID=6832 RepID=A0A553P6H3_TIGCA|nr:F-box only protein 8-like [Tigriopus californicus]TRY73272.1 hypothetical protein TCAL_01931 [Tigriopus californicus]